MTDLDQAVAVALAILEGGDVQRPGELRKLLARHAAHPLVCRALRLLETTKTKTQKHENNDNDNTPAPAATGPRTIGPHGPLPRVHRYANGRRAEQRGDSGTASESL